MKREVVWTSGGEADLQAAFSTLEERATGSGAKFIATLDRLIDLLRRFPEIATTWQGPVRRVLIRRSNHGLFYVVESRRLVVIAVQDLRRDPAALREDVEGRLPGS